MTKKEQIVGDITFETKKDLHKYTQNLIEKRGVCELDMLDKDFSFFLSLYLRISTHLKYVETIKKFKITLDQINKNKANHLLVIDNNNKEFPFSWRDCCNGIVIKPIEKLIDACRTSINEQISSCWHNNSKCNSCGKSCDKRFGKNKTHEFEIDHVIEFSKIFKDFLLEIKTKNTIKIPDDFEGDKITSQTIFKDNDYIFKQEFQKYHREHAELQMLCKECHLLKTNRFKSNKSKKYTSVTMYD